MKTKLISPAVENSGAPLNAETQPRRSNAALAMPTSAFNSPKPMHYQREKNRVLLVSDDFTIRESLGDILRSDGFEVLSVENGVRAVKAFTANTINAIVLDYRTPFDGRDVVSGRSSTLEALTDIDPFLPLVLAREPKADLDHATSLMADLILTHPIVPPALLESIDMLLSETLKERVHRKSGDLAIYR